MARSPQPASVPIGAPVAAPTSEPAIAPGPGAPSNMLPIVPRVSRAIWPVVCVVAGLSGVP